MNGATKLLLSWMAEQEIKTFKELANLLDVNTNTMDSWKQRNSIPFKIIIRYGSYQKKFRGKTMPINDKVKYLRTIKELMESELPISSTIGEELENIVENERYEELPNLFTKISCYLIHFERQNQSKAKL